MEFYRQVNFENLLQNGKSPSKKNRHLLPLSKPKQLAVTTTQQSMDHYVSQTSPKPESSTFSQSSQSSGNNNNSSPYSPPSFSPNFPLNYSLHSPQSIDIVPSISRSHRSRHSHKQPHIHRKSHKHRRHTVNYDFDDLDGSIHSIYSSNNNNNGFGMYGEYEPMLKKGTNYRVYRKTYENKRASKYPNSPFAGRRSKYDRRSNVFDYETSNFDLGSLNEDGT